MRWGDGLGTHAAEVETVSMCSVEAGGETFGIDTRSVHEVLAQRSLQPVPLTPAWIGGMVPYRGEVLTAVSLCALLGSRRTSQTCCVLVLDGDEEGELFGLMVDSVGGVATVPADLFAGNPSTLDARRNTLFAGAYRLPGGLLVQLNPAHLKPRSIAASGLFEGWRPASVEAPGTAGEEKR